MKSKILFSALSFIGLTSIAQVVPNIDWVQYYSERVQISNVPSAIDANSNVYITGYTYPTPSNADITTIKYDAIGNIVWVKHYNNGGFDDANAITLDAASNVYVAGESDGTGTGRDLVVVKYDVNGNQLWASRFNGTANLNDIANAIVVDGSGNVFVTGKTTVAGGTTNYITIKFNSSGVQQWAQTFNGTGNNNDEAIAIDYSSSGRLFISGTSQNSSGNTDIVTIRLNPSNGNQMWAKSINGSANGNDRAYSLLADGNDVVVVGSQKNTSTNEDYITLKYNGNNGNIIWQNNYDNGNSFNEATSIVKDASNNFVVTGNSLNGSYYEYHTVMYNNTGIQQWVNINQTNITYPSVTPKVAVDPIANHFYVCGEKQNANNDINVYQITPSGNKSWEKSFNGAMNSQDAAVDLVVNSMGIVYVAGASLNSNAKFDYTTIRISQTPVYFVPDIANETPSNSIQYFENANVVLNTDGNIAKNVLYFTQGNKTSDYISTNSISHVFSRIDSSHVTQDSLERIDINYAGSNTLTSLYNFEANSDVANFYFPQTGNNGVSLKGAKRLLTPNLWRNIDMHYYTNNAGLKYYFVVKPEGNPNQIKLDISNNASLSMGANGELNLNNILGQITYLKPIAYQVNTLGAIIPVSFSPSYYISGNTVTFKLGTYNTALPLIIEMKNAAPLNTTTAIKNMTWSTYYGGSSEDVFLDLATNNSNSVWVTGYTSSVNFPILNSYQGTNAGNYDAIFVKFNNLGVRQWATYIGGSAGETDYHIHGIEVDNLGNSYSAFRTASNDFPVKQSFLPSEYFDGTNASSAVNAIVAFNNSGQLTWATYFGGAGTNCTTYDIGLDNNSNLIVTGTGGGIPIITPSGSYLSPFSISQGAYIAKFNTNHQLLWSTYIGDANQYIQKVAVNQNEIILVGELYSTSVPTFDFKNFTSSYFDNSFNGGAYDGYLMKFNNNTNDLIWSSLFGGNDDERIRGVVFDNSSNFYVSGESQSNSGLISGNSFGINNTTYSGMGSYFSLPMGDGILAKFNLSNQLISSTYFGGMANEGSYGLSYKNNNLFSSYITAGTDLPFYGSNPSMAFVQANNLDGQDVADDSYFAAMDTDLKFKWSTYFGGTDPSSNSSLKRDYIFSNIATSDNKFYIVGATTSSTSFPLANPGGGAYYAGTKASTIDAFISQFDVTSLPAAVGVKEINLENENLIVFPNPANNFLYIQYKTTTKYNVEIVDITGRIVYFSENHNSNIEKINTENLARGSYIIKVTDKEKYAVKKLIID